MGIRFERADLVIVGGGLLGCWAALQAQRRGLSCVLVDASLPDGSSGLSAQAVPPLRWSATPPPLWRLKSQALKAYLTLEKELGLTLVEPSQHWALAPAQSAQWQQMVELLETHNLPYEPLTPSQAGGRLPQLQPHEEVWAAVERIWEWQEVALRLVLWKELRKRGVKCFGDTPIERLDLEYDQPTALSQDLAFRGRHLWLATGKSSLDLAPQFPSGLENRSHHQVCFATPPERPNLAPLPHLTALFANHSTHLVNQRQTSRFTLNRLRQGTVPDTDADREREAAEIFRARWLPGYLQECPGPPVEEFANEVQQSPDGLPWVGSHPWREDVLLTAGLGVDYAWLAPPMSELGLDLLQGLSQDRTFHWDRKRS